jgi:hypothetical protein
MPTKSCRQAFSACYPRAALAILFIRAENNDLLRLGE